MTYSNFEKKICKFINKYSEIIADYEILKNDRIEDIKFDIFSLFENLIKINKSVDFEEVMLKALIDSIQNNDNILDSLNNIISSETLGNQTLTSTQRYFKEVNDIYEKNDNNYDIEFCEENKNKLIEMNLKSVIAVAKKYQGLGLTLDELISAGNLGLCVAYDRYDKDRSKLKDNMLAAVNNLSDTAKFEYIKTELSSFLKYGDVLNKFTQHFKEGYTYKKEEIKNWVTKNISNAKFNSIANLWIRAYILIELDNFSRVVRKPKTEIYKDAVETGSYKVEQLVNIDASIDEEGQKTYGDMLASETEYDNIEIDEAYDTYKKGLNILLDGIKSRDRSVFLKKFGIGLPRPLQPSEISQQENLSIARISQILQTVIEKIQENAVKYNVNINELFEASKKLK